MTTTPEAPTRMRYYRHAANGHICWTYPTSPALNYTSPAPGEGPGHKHCPYPHDNPRFLTELPETDARTLLSPTSGRKALTNRIHHTIDFDHLELFGGEDEPGYPTERSLSIAIADTLITAGVILPTTVP